MARVTKTEKKLFVVYDSAENSVTIGPDHGEEGKVFSSEKEAREFVEEKIENGDWEYTDEIIVCELTPVSRVEKKCLSWRNVDKFDE